MLFNKTSKPKLIILHRYPPEFELIPCPGLKKIYKMLSEEYNLIHYGMNWKDLPDSELRKYIEVKEIPLKINLKSGFDKWFKTILYYFYLPILLLRLKKEKPKLIIYREIFPFVSSILSLLKIPMIIEITDWWPSIILGSSKFGRVIANFIESLEVKYWTKLNVIAITHNNFETKLLLERGMPKEKIRRINLPMYGGVYSPHNSKDIRKNLKFRENNFVVAIHGIIHKSKGYDQILRWWAELIKIHPNWKLLFIGGTMGEGWFRRLISELHLEKNMVLAGWISDQHKLNIYLNAADCLLATRRNTPDTFGNTPSALTHNLMTGKPTLSTGTPGISEVIRNGKNGYIFKPGNYDSFKSALEFIYAHPSKAKEVGKKGMKRVKEYFDVHKEAKDYLEVIKRLVI